MCSLSFECRWSRFPFTHTHTRRECDMFANALSTQSTRNSKRYILTQKSTEKRTWRILRTACNLCAKHHKSMLAEWFGASASAQRLVACARINDVRIERTAPRVSLYAFHHLAGHISAAIRNYVCSLRTRRVFVDWPRVLMRRVSMMLRARGARLIVHIYSDSIYTCALILLRNYIPRA